MRRAWMLWPLLLGGCGAGSESGSSSAIVLETPAPAAYTLRLRVLSDTGAPLEADVEIGGVVRRSAPDGRVSVPGLLEPAVAVASAPGFLPEPLVLGPEDAAGEAVIRLRAETGPGGLPRVALHFGGDVMLGRRYVASTAPDTHLVVSGDGGASARAAVSSLAPLFRAANLRIANVETAIGELPESAAYPGKRFLIQSVPEITHALNEIGLDVACLGNNHVRDWLEAGIASTILHLEAANISWTGAGATQEEAAKPAIRDVGGLRVGVLSYSSITGDSVNEAYPDEADPTPSFGDPKFAFKWQSRVWGHPSFGIPVLSRRIRSVWEIIQAFEETNLGNAARAELWTSASAVYPELQDWVARRGHGGANWTSPARMPGHIQALRDAGCDLVVVMVHNGHEYMEFPSASTARDAYRFIDAGADIVVAHHAHVQQGFEFYKGKLICMGLGNCFFDQDFMSTFLSGVLRVVYEGTSMIEARFIPIAILRYRPAPVVGRVARSALRMVHERSAVEARTDYYGPIVRAVTTPRAPDTAAPGFKVDGYSALVEPWDGATSSLGVTAGRGQPADLPETGLIRSRGPGGVPLPGILFGRDLLRWGAFDDEVADGVAAGGPQWNTFGASPSAAIPVTPDAPSGDRTLQLARSATNTARVRLRPVALVTVPPNRIFRETGPDTALPADGPASYSLRFKAKKKGPGEARFTLDAYNFSSTFAAGPDTVFLRSLELAFSLPEDDLWHELLVDVPASHFASFGTFEANALLIYVGLHPSPEGPTTLAMDDLEFVEWRSPDLMPDGYYEATSVRAAADGPPVTRTLERRPE